MTTHVEYGSGHLGLERQRAHCRDVCDVDPLTVTEAFHADCEVAKVGSTLFILTRTTSVAYVRRPLHIVRGGDAHYQIQLQLDGLLHGSSSLGVSDVGVHDMGRPSITEVHAIQRDPRDRARVLTWLVPRVLLAPQLSSPEAVHGLRFAGSTRYGRMLGDLLWSVWTNAPLCDEREGAAAAYSLLLLLAGGLGQSDSANEAVSRATRGAKLEAIKHYIDAQLGRGDIRVNDVAQRFGLSRASLYRLFEPDGGFTSHVRSRRMHYAARLLVSSTHRHLRVLDIALESRFEGEASFVRAFRREFGLSPAALRASVDAHGIVRLSEVEPLEWLRNIRARSHHIASASPSDSEINGP
jgi:AraC-like DNA-binding protein